jgi:hypothetical protein
VELNANVYALLAVGFFVVSRNTKGPSPFHPPPTSWLNQMETWLSILHSRPLSGASFALEQLREHVDAFIAAYSETAVPFEWTKKKFKVGVSKIALSPRCDSAVRLRLPRSNQGQR